MVKAVFFDVANTLLDKPDLYSKIEAVLLQYGNTVDRELLIQRHRLLSEIIAFPDRTSARFYQTFNSELLLMLGILPEEKLVNDIFEACRYLPWSAFQDVACLKELPLPKGVISNWDKTLYEKLNELIDVSFDWVLGSENVGVRKPDIGFYKNMLELTGYQASEVLYIGDSIKLDIQPARKLGIRAVLIDRLGLYPGTRIPKMNSLTELKNFL